MVLTDTERFKLSQIICNKVIFWNYSSIQRYDSNPKSSKPCCSECDLQFNKDFEFNHGRSLFTFESQTCVTLSKSKESNEIQQLWWNEIDVVNHCDCICYKPYIFTTFAFLFSFACFFFFITTANFTLRFYKRLKTVCCYVE